MGITSTDNSATIASTADNGPAGVQHYISPGPDGVLFVPDAHLLFSGRYGRSGSDLVINGDDGARAIVPDYFSQALPPDLYSPDGAVLTGDVVSRLAGPRFPMHFAQVGQPAGQAPIGQVETISGTATATHANGAVDTLALRSPVYAGDIIETAAGANVGITFADRTVLSVDSGTRMTLDQFVYAPGGTGNASLMNLIQGSFSFIAGQVAPTGDMRIETPVSSMSIRGTTGRAFLVANDGSTAHVLFRDPAPPGVIGALGAIDVNNKLTGTLIRALRLEGEGVIVRNTAGDFEDYTPTPLQQGADQAGIALVTAAFAAQQARINAGEPVLNPIPGGQPGQPGQPVPPDPGQPQPPPQPLQQQPAPQDPSQPPPADPQRGGAAPGDGQTQLGSLDVIIDPANGAVLASIAGAGAVLEPIGAVRSVSLLGNEFLGLVPLLPNEFATDAATAAATGEADTSDPLSPLPPLGASLTVPGGQSVAEDGSVVIGGFNVGGSGSLTVTLNASSTVTLATLSGLTFLVGDGTADSTMTFTGTADAIDAALNGLTYQPTPDHDTSGLITLSIGDGTTTVDSIVAIAITPVPDQPQVTGNIGSQSVVVNGNFAVDASSVFQNIDTGSTTTYSAILQGGGALPSWLSFDAATGILSGTPPGTSTETVTVLVTATTSEGLSSSQAFTLTAAPDRVGTAGGDVDRRQRSGLELHPGRCGQRYHHDRRGNRCRRGRARDRQRHRHGQRPDDRELRQRNAGRILLLRQHGRFRSGRPQEPHDRGGHTAASRKRRRQSGRLRLERQSRLLSRRDQGRHPVDSRARPRWPWGDLEHLRARPRNGRGHARFVNGDRWVREQQQPRHWLSRSLVARRHEDRVHVERDQLRCRRYQRPHRHLHQGPGHGRDRAGLGRDRRHAGDRHDAARGGHPRRQLEPQILARWLATALPIDSAELRCRRHQQPDRHLLAGIDGTQRRDPVPDLPRFRWRRRQRQQHGRQLLSRRPNRRLCLVVDQPGRVRHQQQLVYERHLGRLCG